MDSKVKITKGDIAGFFLLLAFGSLICYGFLKFIADVGEHARLERSEVVVLTCQQGVIYRYTVRKDGNIIEDYHSFAFARNAPIRLTEAKCPPKGD